METLIIIITEVKDLVWNILAEFYIAQYNYYANEKFVYVYNWRYGHTAVEHVDIKPTIVCCVQHYAVDVLL